MINFYIPNFYEGANLNLFLIDLMQHHPCYFRDNIKIGAAYGSFPGAIWNGGRAKPGGYPPEEEWESFQNLIWEYNSRGVPIRFTWTNLLLKEEHLEDEMCNRIMKLAHNGRNEILVANELLENYLKKKYPKYKYVSSITKCIQDEKEFTNLVHSDQYYMVVLDYRNNRNYEFLKSFSNEIKNKIEILVNSRCFEDCPNLKAHYGLMSKLQLENRSISSQDPFFNCRAYSNDIYELFKLRPLMINDYEIYNFYYPELGYKNYKIEGRNFSLPEIIESLIHYLVKPEYKNKIRLVLLNHIWRN